MIQYNKYHRRGVCTFVFLVLWRENRYRVRKGFIKLNPEFCFEGFIRQARQNKKRCPSWLRSIKVPNVRCTVTIRFSFQKTNPVEVLLKIMRLMERHLIGGYCNHQGASQALVVKNTPANAGDVREAGSIPGSGRSPGGRNGNPLQFSCLENPHGQRSLMGYSPQDRKELDMTEATDHTYCNN